VKQTINIENATKEQIKENIENHAPLSLIGLKNLLFSLNITSKISLGAYRIHKGKIKTDWELSVYGKENLEKFQNLISFDVFYKNELLSRCLSSYKFPSAARNQRILYALQYAASLELKNGFVDKFSMAEETKRALWRTCSYYLIDLKKRGFVEAINKQKSKNKPWRYRITQKGWVFLKDNSEFIFLEAVRNSIKDT